MYVAGDTSTQGKRISGSDCCSRFLTRILKVSFKEQGIPGFVTLFVGRMLNKYLITILGKLSFHRFKKRRRLLLESLDGSYAMITIGLEAVMAILTSKIKIEIEKHKYKEQIKLQIKKTIKWTVFKYMLC